MLRLRSTISSLSRTAALPAVACCCPAASGRQFYAYEATAAYSLSFREIERLTGLPSSATPGIIDPSESVRISLSVAFTPAVGVTTPYLPANPPPGFGEVVGWSQTLVDLIGVGSTLGSFSNFTAAEGFEPRWLATSGGNIIGFGAFSLLQPPINQSNPVIGLVEVTWFPADYTPRLVSFHTMPPGEGGNAIGLRITPPGQASFLIDAEVPGGHITQGNTGSIVIVPSPSSLIILAAIAFGPRRSRRGVA